MNFKKIIKEELEVLNLLKQFNNLLNEGFSSSDFGNNASMGSSSVTIPKENTNIKSASSGVIENFSKSLWCKNQTTVKFSYGDSYYYLEYCGITDPKVSKGTNVNKGTILGTTTEDVKVNLYDSRGRGFYFKEFNKISPSKTSTPNVKTTTTDNTGLVKYDNRYKKFEYKSRTVGDAVSGVAQDNRYKKFDW